MSKASTGDVLEIPASVWESSETKEEVEDWLLSQNPAAILQLREIRRKEDLAGQGKPLSEIARKWNIKL